MARKFTVSLDLNKNELLNARLQNLSADPSLPVAGQIYYNTTYKETRFYDGTQWIAGGATKYGLLSERPAASKGGILYVATDNQTLYLDNGTSWVQISVNPQDLADAVQSLTDALDAHNNSATGVHGVSGDVVGTSDQQTLTNKVIGTGSRLGSDFDADGYKINWVGDPVSDKDAANKEYVDTQISASEAATALTFNGTSNEVTVDRSGNNVTIGLPDDVVIAGEVTAASGHILGNLQVDGDVNIEGTLNAINRTEVNIDDNTIVLNTNFTGAPTADAGITVNRGDESDVSITWDETNDLWTLTNNGSNYHAIARKYAITIGDGLLTQFTIMHNLGTKDVTVQIFENNSSYAQVEADVEHTDANYVRINFATAPSSNEYRVVIVG
jgi:hypothetical protein